MAPARSKAQSQIGSAQWISVEQENINRFGDQEVEDFVFAARNEVDWLNEHMAEIFSSNQFNVTEIFKTPGKLRGKTPRTARKRNPLESRVPLSDVFSKNHSPKPSPLHGTDIFKAVTAVEVPRELISAPLKEPEAEVNRVAKHNTDSGYHGMTEDEMDIDPVPSTTRTTEDEMDIVPVPSTTRTTEDEMDIIPVPSTTMTTESKTDTHSHSALQAPDVNPSGTRPSEDRRTTEGSFHSAREDLTSKVLAKDSPQRNVPTTLNMNEEHSEEDVQLAPAKETSSAEVEVITAIQGEHMEKDSLLDVDPAVDESRSSSEGSSPVRPLVRKSSLTFAALPAREPLTTKKSIGARVSRISHLDQSKINPLSRGSVLGRFIDGKSLSGTQQKLQDDEARMDEDERIDHRGNNDEDIEMVDEERPALTREESDGDAKITKLHNKSSTQRLHERINMLGQSHPPRPTKSIPAVANVAVQPSYPELTCPGIEEIKDLEHMNPPLPNSNTVNPIDDNDNDDDDDWIKPPPVQSKEQKPTKLSNEYSADVVEEVNPKNGRGGYESRLGTHERPEAKGPQPFRQHAVSSKPTSNGLVHAKSVSAPNLISPSRVTTATGKNHDVDNLASNTVLPSLAHTEQFVQQSTTPARTPVSRRHVDGPLSASKSKLQSIMKTARGLFTSSAGISAQAKMETFSPRSMRSRGPAQGPIESNNADVGLYPDLHNAGTALNLVDELPGHPLKKGEALRTRNSMGKEDKRIEKELKERERVESELEKVRETERQKAARYEEELSTTASSKKIPLSEQERVPESTESETPQLRTAIRKNPRRIPTRGEPVSNIEVTQASSISVEHSETAGTMLPPPPRTQTDSQIQKPKDLRRPIKPARDTASKPKPQPVSIRVGTLSQRIPLNNTVLSSSLQESLPPPQSKPAGVVKKASNVSLQTSASGVSLKTSVSSTSTKPKALLAAERKKEQDEKEAQRKLDQKREVERKRAAQQDEARKQEQQQRQEMERQRERERTASAEDPRKLAQKQAIEKRRLELGKKDQQRNPQRMTNDLANALQQDKPQAHGAPFRGELGGTRAPSRLVQDSSRPVITYPAVNPAKPPTKRVFEPDNEDEPMRPARVQGGPLYQQTDAKRRRTNDEDVQEVPVRPTMAPPIRQSNVRPKDGPKQSMFSNGKSHGHGQIRQRQDPLCRKPEPRPTPHKTPLPSKKGGPHAAKSSPNYINPDNIDLAEIPTDSDSDSDSEADNKKQSLMASWVQSPALREQLRAQEDGVDPEAVFGPIAPLNMEEIFDKSRHHRFRSRTSSANWAGQDRLTEEEVRVDLAARERLRREGGWTYGL
ncbi:MAG: hypothetical protein FRX48_01499 [Lasallia pustulata]|uniref:Inner centromere protein ARK-binding domain-containing protein n=1 Tax=Lasallia pustulata TaxID=136370 RepID=A0A5M8PY91_9LECA|nr:MAG: hypothetical protein FRX48_01499 [Lasallia pustulata]